MKQKTQQPQAGPAPRPTDEGKHDVVDLTQADLDRGLTPEQIAREKADLNWAGFRRDIVRVIQDGLAKKGENS